MICCQSMLIHLITRLMFDVYCKRICNRRPVQDAANHNYGDGVTVHTSRLSLQCQRCHVPHYGVSRWLPPRASGDSQHAAPQLVSYAGYWTLAVRGLHRHSGSSGDPVGTRHTRKVSPSLGYLGDLVPGFTDRSLSFDLYEQLSWHGQLLM